MTCWQDLIGRTPLLKLKKVTADSGAEIIAKYASTLLASLPRASRWLPSLRSFLRLARLLPLLPPPPLPPQPLPFPSSHCFDAFRLLSFATSAGHPLLGGGQGALQLYTES